MPPFIDIVPSRNNDLQLTVDFSIEPLGSIMVPNTHQMVTMSIVGTIKPKAFSVILPS